MGPVPATGSVRGTGSVLETGLAPETGLVREGWAEPVPEWTWDRHMLPHRSRST